MKKLSLTCQSKGTEACSTPLMPPTVNRAIRPQANSSGVLNAQRAAPHGGQPVEDLHAGRDGDQHAGAGHDRR